MLIGRHVNETRNGRGRGKEHEAAAAEANSHEAKAEAEAEAEAEAKIALIFKAKFYILTPFSPKTEIFGRFST